MPRSLRNAHHIKDKHLQELVFDIETVPFKDEEYSEAQNELIQRKLNTVLLRNPTADIKAETGKIKGTDPYLSRVVCIGLYYPATDLRISLTNDADESEILKSFWAQLAGYSGLFISYNGVRFDVPYIVKRSMKYGIKPTNTSFLYYTKFDPMPPHFDAMLQLCGRDGSYSLKQACDFFGIPSPKDGAVTSSSVGDAFYAGRINEIAEYCLRDLESTYLLYQKVKNYIPNR